MRFEQVGTIDYLAAWELQKQVHERVVAGAQDDTVLLLEHPPVYTAGKRTDPHERPVDSSGAPVIDVDRGGKITFHGPGQLVAYPIVRLPDHVIGVPFHPDAHYVIVEANGGRSLLAEELRPPFASTIT